MRKLICVMLTAVLCLSTLGFASAETYSASAPGFGGDVTVTLTVTDGVITDVTAEGANETQGIGSQAIEQMPGRMVEANSVEVDGVTGATLTSTAILEAAKEALAQAGTQSEETEEAPNAMNPGVYEGTAAGFHGPIRVQIEVTDTQILSVKTLEEDESFKVGDSAFETLESSVVANQSIADTVTCATVTSNGFRNAVKAALKEAGANEALIRQLQSAPIACTKYEDSETDVVVVGAGVAGMVAAMQAYDQGARVVLLEKNDMAGGSARLSAGGILSVGAPEVTDTEYTVEDIHRWYSIQAGPVNNDPVFYEIMNRSNEMLDYIKANGLHILRGNYNQKKLAPIFRALVVEHHGISVYEALFNAVLDRDIDYRNRNTVTSLLQDENGTVTGVVVENGAGTYEIHAKNVILATGGYTYNQELMEKYSAHWADAFKITASGATGDGHIMGTAAGGHIIGEGVLDIFITGNDPSLYGGQPGFADLFVDSNGNQVGAMDEYYGTLTVKIQNLPDKTAYQIFSAGNMYFEFDNENDEKNMKRSDLEKLVEMGTMVKADTIEELAEKIGIEPAALVRTVEEHNWYYDLQINDAWGTEAAALQPIREAPYYAAKITPCVMGTVAGLEINDQMQVVNDQGEAIPGLYAAGELIFGNVFNQIYPMAGTGIDVALSSGYLAGIHAGQNLE